MQDFVPFFVVEKLCKKYCLDPEPWSEPEPEPELEPEPKLFQSRNRKDNKSLRFHNTAKDISEGMCLIFDSLDCGLEVEMQDLSVSVMTP